MKGLRDDLFASTMLSGNKNVGIGGPDARNQFQYRLHGRRFGDQGWTRLRAEKPVLGFEARCMAQRLAKVDLSAQDTQEPRVFPWFLKKIARAATHCFDGNFDAAPGGHDNDWKRAVHNLDSA